MDTGNIGRYVVSVIVAVLLASASFRLIPTVQQNADKYLMMVLTVAGAANWMAYRQARG